LWNIVQVVVYFVTALHTYSHLSTMVVCDS